MGWGNGMQDAMEMQDRVEKGDPGWDGKVEFRMGWRNRIQDRMEKGIQDGMEKGIQDGMEE